MVREREREQEIKRQCQGHKDREGQINKQIYVYINRDEVHWDRINNGKKQ